MTTNRNTNEGRSTFYETTNSRFSIPELNRSFEACTHIGLRPAQEDRLVLCPSFLRPDLSIACVFDGTVGDDASNFCQQNILDVMTSEGGTFSHKGIFDDSNLADQANVDLIAGKISEAMRQTFLETDKRLLNMCRERRLHYASSTGVVAVLWRNLLTIAHVGDSKACIVRESGGSLLPEWLTEDHKPNMPNELARIESSGGSLAWLHGNKPYIRGGDFTRRQQNGEHPKQLNYSRAFGGKDLKCYGLIADPDVSQFYINPDDKLVLIASDGLWDVLNPRVACDIAMRAKAEGRSATQSLVHWAIQEMPHVGVRDNVTVLALFVNDNDVANDSGAVPLGVTMDITTATAAATVAKTVAGGVVSSGVGATNGQTQQQSWSSANVPIL